MPDQLRAEHDFSCNDFYCMAKAPAVWELYAALQEAINRAVSALKVGLPCGVDGVVNRGTVDAAKRAAAAYKGDNEAVKVVMKKFLSNPRKEELATFPYHYTAAFNAAAEPPVEPTVVPIAAPLAEAAPAAMPTLEGPVVEPAAVLQGPVVESVPTPLAAPSTALVPVLAGPTVAPMPVLGETGVVPWYQNKWVWIGSAAAVVALVGIYVVVKSSSGASSEAY